MREDNSDVEQFESRCYLYLESLPNDNSEALRAQTEVENPLRYRPCAADMVLKERRWFQLVVRETLLHLGHLRLMTIAAELVAVIMPRSWPFTGLPKQRYHLIDRTLNSI
ncbi:MAG: Flavin prenyltransferase PAD1, mitochondrial [Sodalis sp.]|nr:MAG: Flavin prenyltransferase PAD1, mitochondrial [Sodalis sp.]